MWSNLSFLIWTDSVLCFTRWNVFVIHGTFFLCTLLLFALYLVPFIEHLRFVTGSLHFFRPFWMLISTRSVQTVWGVYVFYPVLILDYFHSLWTLYHIYDAGLSLFWYDAEQKKIFWIKALLLVFGLKILKYNFEILY